MDHVNIPVPDLSSIYSRWVDINSPPVQAALTAAKQLYDLTPAQWGDIIAHQERAKLNTLAGTLLDTGFPPPSLMAPNSPNFPPYSNTTLTTEQKKTIPPRVIERLTAMPPVPYSFYCATRKETWWKGPVGFMVQDTYTQALWLHYTLALQNEELRNWEPRRRGRPASSATSHEPKPKNELYAKWLALCAARKAEAAALQNDLADALARVAECRAAIRAHEAGTVTWQDYQSQHTT